MTDNIVRQWTALVVLLAVAVLSACQPAETPAVVAEEHAGAACASALPEGEVSLAGGAFTLGAEPERPEEGPQREVTVAPFSIDKTEVTNAQFAEFVAATGYVTDAERPADPALYPGVPPELLQPSSLVFVGARALGNGDPTQWWRIVDGANWRHPEGPASDLRGRERHPVVHVSHRDALAYARWRGRDLPSEAEWEFAARGGLDGARYEHGDERPGPQQANTWQGLFPAYDSGEDGYKAETAPVGCYQVNGFGLYDMTGNVWEWTNDWFENGAGGAQRQHLIKGGSFLCADNFCARFRPSAREGGPPDTGASHVGFRTVLRQSEN